MRRLFICLSLVLALLGCAERHEESVATSVYVGGREPKYGDYSRVEVDALKIAISKISFPAPEHTVVRRLPRALDGSAYVFSDGVATSSAKSKVGGNIMDYWLNREFVLRVATAYYSERDSRYSMDEWAVVLSRSELSGFKRDI